MLDAFLMVRSSEASPGARSPKDLSPELSLLGPFSLYVSRHRVPYTCAELSGEEDGPEARPGLPEGPGRLLRACVVRESSGKRPIDSPGGLMEAVRCLRGLRVRPNG